LDIQLHEASTVQVQLSRLLGTYVPKTRQGFARIMLSMWIGAATNDFCPDDNWEVTEELEINTPCPRCGLPAKHVHFMQVQQLLNRKGQNQRMRKKMLFHSDQSNDDLVARSISYEVYAWSG
jgi:rubredoxin